MTGGKTVWICANCGARHKYNDPPCRECAHEQFAKLVEEDDSPGPTEQIDWQCANCGTSHVRNSPPCNQCGGMQFEAITDGSSAGDDEQPAVGRSAEETSDEDDGEEDGEEESLLRPGGPFQQLRDYILIGARWAGVLVTVLVLIGAFGNSATIMNLGFGLLVTLIPGLLVLWVLLWFLDSVLSYMRDSPEPDGARPEPADGVTSQGRTPTEGVDDGLAASKTVTRRRLVAAGVGIVGVLGVGAYLQGTGQNKPTHRVYGEGWDTTRSEGQRSVEITGSVTVPEGRYAVWNVRPQRTVQYEIDFSVPGDTQIDVITMDADEYDRYRDRDTDTQYRSALSSLRTSGGVLQSVVPAGEYHIVFDNTAVYGAQPDGEVTVDVQIVARV